MSYLTTIKEKSSSEIILTKSHVRLVIQGSLATWIQTKSGASHCFLEQEILHLLLSTGWFQERIQECFYMLKAFFTIELK